MVSIGMAEGRGCIFCQPMDTRIEQIALFMLALQDFKDIPSPGFTGSCTQDSSDSLCISALLANDFAHIRFSDF